MRPSLPLLILAVALQPSHAQTPATYRIAGTVVSSIDHHPLQHATIQLLNPENQQPEQSTRSDEYGRFAFTHVPAGNHELQGAAPGYLATFYQEHDGFNTGIITGAGVDTESLTLQLIPEGTITGIVVDEAAEPVEDAHILLFRRTNAFGDGRIAPAQMAMTNDLGHFELAHLQPGTYFVAVSASPWYATHPNAAQTPFDNPGVGGKRGPPAFGFADAIDPTLDVAFPTAYYPGTPESDRAQPITIRGGDSTDLHFQLPSQPAVTISIPHAAPKRGQQEAMPQLHLSMFGLIEPVVGADVRQVGNQIQITGVAPGDYLLSDPHASSGQSDGGTPLHVDGRAATATLDPASGLAHVHVLLRSANGEASPPNLSLTLIHRRSHVVASHPVNEKAQADLDVSPGDYYFAVQTHRETGRIVQILADSDAHRLPTNDLHLNPDDSRAFIITYAVGSHILKGVARKDGKPFAGAFILLIPTNELHDIHDFYRQQSDLDGSWDIGGLAPGDYTLFVIDNGWDLDWQSETVLSRYLPTAVPIHIPDASVKTHTLLHPVAVQPR